jgi:uncharacterized protein
MPYFALMYEVVDDFVARRVPFRAEHLRCAGESHARGEIVMAGALADPADAALIIFRCVNRSIAEEFARRDPYVSKCVQRPGQKMDGASLDRRSRTAA